MHFLLPYRYKTFKTWATLCVPLFLCLQVQGQKPLKYNQTPVHAVNNASLMATDYYRKDNSSIHATIRPYDKEGVFTAKSKHIGYALRLENKAKEPQIGNISMHIANAAGVVLYKEVYPFTLNKKGIFIKDYNFGRGQLQPGFYISSLSVITNRYADSMSYSFGYEPSKITTKSNAPTDLVGFWEQAKIELANTAPNYIVTPRPDLSNRRNDAYEIEYKSTDRATIYGWLTVPKSGRNHPVIYQISDYQSELKPEYRSNAAVLSINTRGAGASNENYNYDYNQLGLVNIKDRYRYFLKGTYLDALRGLDLLTLYGPKLNLDTRRIVASGFGLGGASASVLAAIDTRLRGVVVEAPNFIGMRDILSFGESMPNAGFPASMFKAYINNQKNVKDAVLQTLDYFDPVNFAPYINCPILTGFSLHNINVPAQSVYNFIGGLRVKKKDIYECKECGNSLDKKFYGFKETWLKEKFGQP